ncbi:mitochondrial DNA-3-methyladenine glycosylase [Andalucia godoyi]|uniref:Mitochondrial DNA-3-methyladenine glycosylase n=1 Tax=Andalucia godoyi TaxID=505711 RepID=A0A8K0AH87_ANDGO|nr:mitochondrial DNA-3-methyladenine glycosylase [Andalucia godoyi]|eukprot:ANDGO_06388.mRNA.1 mitochondrial DNA-3-methyladenine glycosylase
MLASSIRFAVRAMSRSPKIAADQVCSGGAADDVSRCEWGSSDPLYIKYHDEEWGTATHDDRVHFEFLVLESAQAGLSWITVLRKRENYRKAFADFDAARVSEFTDAHVEELLKNPGIIRNRAKIKAAISNAKIFLAIQQEFGSFDKYLYGFVPGGKPVVFSGSGAIPPRTELSDTIAADLKNRGFKFFGSTICYAHLQAVGVVNDHLPSCFRRTGRKMCP